MVGSKAAKSVRCIREEKRQLASEDRTRPRVRRKIRSRRACHRSWTVILVCKVISQSGRLARPFSFFISFVCYLCRKVWSAEERDVILQCSSSPGAGKFVRSRSASAFIRVLRTLAKRFQFSFILLNVYFANPLLDERELAQDVDCSLAAVVLRQREWKRKGHRPQPSNTRISNSINVFHQCQSACSH